MLNPPLLEHAESERQHNKTDNNFFTNTPDIKKPNRVGLLISLCEILLSHKFSLRLRKYRNICGSKEKLP